MFIKNLLYIFNILDNNQDNVLSEKEIGDCSFQNTIWSGIIKANLSKEEFILQGLTIEKSNYDNEDSLSGFDIQHQRLVKQNIKPVSYIGDYCVYENQARLYVKDVNSYDEIPSRKEDVNVKNACGVDISKLELTQEQLLNLIIDDYTTLNEEQKTIFDKAKINTNQMGCGIEKLHQEGYTGYGAMALLDQKYCKHTLYNDRLNGTIDIGENINSEQGPSWHVAAMLSIMHKTSPTSEIYHYCVTDENSQIQDEQFAQAIRDILDKNKSLCENKKIRTIVMGWGFYRNNPKYEEYINLCREAINNGIFIASNNTSELYGIEVMGTNRSALTDVNSASSYCTPTYINYKDLRDIPEEIKDNKILYLPMQHLTIGSADGKSIQYEGNDGGICWANAVGSLYNDFVDIKPDITPQEFINLLMSGSDKLIVEGIYCGRLLNAKKSMDILKANMQD